MDTHNKRITRTTKQTRRNYNTMIHKKNFEALKAYRQAVIDAKCMCEHICKSRLKYADQQLKSLKAKIEAEGCGAKHPDFEISRCGDGKNLCPDCQQLIKEIEEILK
jgi:hypothetical protein